MCEDARSALALAAGSARAPARNMVLLAREQGLQLRAKVF
jgi:hypothetical protein